MTVWEKIELMMARGNLRLIDVARIAGVRQSAVTKWKHGGRIGQQYLNSLAEKFQCNALWLMGRDEYAPSHQDLRTEPLPTATNAPIALVAGLEYFSVEEISAAARRALDSNDHAAAHVLTGELSRRCAAKEDKT
jgi:transcriptional regulator with XRE-family HTH domain